MQERKKNRWKIKQARKKYFKDGKKKVQKRKKELAKKDRNKKEIRGRERKNY